MLQSQELNLYVKDYQDWLGKKSGLRIALHITTKGNVCTLSELDLSRSTEKKTFLRQSRKFKHE